VIRPDFSNYTVPERNIAQRNSIMAEPTKRTIVLVRITSGLIGLAYAGFATLFLHKFWPSMEMIPGVLVFIILLIGFYIAGVWMFIDRPIELNKKFPITSNEVRKRRKAFYDWLNLHNRH
jgi:protein-S-isoprenylcysteine O-methyltransferase Ste14